MAFKTKTALKIERFDAELCALLDRVRSMEKWRDEDKRKYERDLETLRSEYRISQALWEALAEHLGIQFKHTPRTNVFICPVCGCGAPDGHMHLPKFKVVKFEK